MADKKLITVENLESFKQKQDREVDAKLRELESSVSGAAENVIESISVNGVPQAVNNKNVDLQISATGGGVTSYNDLTDKPDIPTRVSELTNDSFAPIGRDDILGAFNTKWMYKDMTAEQKEYYAQEAGMSNDSDVLWVGKYRLYFTAYWNYIEIRYSGNIEQGMNAYLGGARGYTLEDIGENRQLLRLTDAQGRFLDLAQVYADEVGGTLSEDFPDFVDFVSNGAELILDVENGVMRLYSPTLEAAGEYPYFYNEKYNVQADGMDNVLYAARKAYQEANNRMPRALDGGGTVLFNTINHESLSQDPVITQTDIRVDNYSWYASQYQQYADDYEKENYIALHGTWLNANDNNIMSEAKCSVGTYDVQLMSDEGDANGDHISSSLLLSNNDLTLTFSTYNYLNNNYTPGTDVEYSLKTVSEKAMSAIQPSDLSGYATESYVQDYVANNASSGGSSVSGINDGTNWTSLTVNGDTYAIPNSEGSPEAFNLGSLVGLYNQNDNTTSYNHSGYSMKIFASDRDPKIDRHNIQVEVFDDNGDKVVLSTFVSFSHNATGTVPSGTNWESIASFSIQDELGNYDSDSFWVYKGTTTHTWSANGNTYSDIPTQEVYIIKHPVYGEFYWYSPLLIPEYTAGSGITISNGVISSSSTHVWTYEECAGHWPAEQPSGIYVDVNSDGSYAVFFPAGTFGLPSDTTATGDITLSGASLTLSNTQPAMLSSYLDGAEFALSIDNEGKFHMTHSQFGSYEKQLEPGIREKYGEPDLTQDGTYVLKATVSSGVVTYSWVLEA